MNASAKLFIALVIVVAGYGLASLFGPAQFSPRVSSWSLASGNDSTADENAAVVLGDVQLTPDTAPAKEAPPSAILKGTVAPSPSANVDASSDAPPTELEPAPLWLNARADRSNSPRDNASPKEQFAVSREDWSGDEARIVSPAFFADATSNRDLAVNEGMPSASAMQTTSYAELDDAESMVRTHVIIDGDSLTRLAELYLDDPGRWQEIFALNRDRLTDPGLLPIGVEIDLPPKTASAADSNSAEGMVKVDPATISANQPPEARLLHPQSAKPIYQQYHFTVAD